MITIHDIELAAHRLAGSVLRTPSVPAPALSKLLGRVVVLKLENLQIGGSFKRRGVLNRLLHLSDDERGRTLVAVSGGNFGIALADACATMNVPVTIVLPASAPRASVQRIGQAGATILREPDVAAAFAAAANLAERGCLQIDDCDDALIAAGSGTLALEFLEDVPGLTDVIVAVGGGSMITGVATAVRTLAPGARIWGVETAGADSMARAVEQGQPVRIEVTSAISTLGIPIVSSTFFECVRSLVHKVVVVRDQDAFSGVVDFAEKAHIWVEPAAGAVLAAAQRICAELPEDAVVGLVVCGGNATVADVTDHFLKAEPA